MKRFWDWFTPGDDPVLAACALVVLANLAAVAGVCWALNGLAV